MFRMSPNTPDSNGLSMTPYEPRRIEFLELWRAGDWRLKLYGIAYARARPRPPLVAAAKRIASAQLASLPTDLEHYRVGFLGVHEGRTSNFIFLDFWTNENELRHHVFVSPISRPDEFLDFTPTSLSACVWDLHLQAFERDAWVAHVLRQSTSPDFDGYLSTTLNADV